MKTVIVLEEFHGRLHVHIPVTSLSIYSLDVLARYRDITTVLGPLHRLNGEKLIIPPYRNHRT